MNPSSAVAGAEWALRRYHELGLPLRTENRLQRARNFLAQFAGTDEPLDVSDSNLLHRIPAATQTCFEHYIISRATRVPSGVLDPVHAAKLALSITGADAPEIETNSIGRDTQFELFVAAILAMGGVKVGLAEPDLQMEYCGVLTGVAAKRVKSPSKIRRRFKDGIGQIERSGQRGFVALNADLVIHGLDLGGSAPAHYGAQFNKRLNVLQRLDEKYAGHPLAAGRIVFGTDAVWRILDDTPTLEFAFFRQVWCYPDDEDDAERGYQFFESVGEIIDRRMNGEL